jgi:CRISPR-associated protein Cas1
MGTIYITQDESFIDKIDERIQIKADKKVLIDVPLIKVDGVVVMGRSSVSPAALTELLDRKIPLTFLTHTGKYLGKLEPEMTKNIFIRQAQWQADGETEKAVHLVRAFVRGKLKNYRTSLQRRQREEPTIELDKAISQINNAISSTEKVTAIASLRGLEGAGSAAYFGAFNSLIKTPEFTFSTRERRPPTDPVNSLLSLGYSLLRHDVQSAVNIVGFDPYLGYLHVKHYGRPALALDLMEEFRPLVIDAMVLSAINKKLILPTDFVTEPISGAVSLTKDALKTFLRLYEQKKQSEFKHPVMGKKCTYQSAFEVQARLVGKYLMGETDKYPPLVLK